jgi:hypothetical protein
MLERYLCSTTDRPESQGPPHVVDSPVDPVYSSRATRAPGVSSSGNTAREVRVITADPLRREKL